MPEHDAIQVQWEDDEFRKKARFQIQESFDQNGFQHVHIEGKAGVGKTRFALEVCKAAKWENRVLYGLDFSSNAEKDIRQLIELQSNMVLAIDEINDTKELKKLKRICESYDNIKLLTMGHAEIEDSESSHSILLDVISEEGIARIVDRWYGNIYSNNFSSYTAYLAEGYVRFARMVANAIHKEIRERGGMLSPEELLNKNNITTFLNKLIGDNETDRRALHICSMLTFFGYRNQYAEEGKIIAKKFNMEWSDFVSKIEYFINKKIVQRTENYFYISPTLLAIYLAKEAHDFCRKVNGDNYIFDLLNELPSEAKKRYCARIAEVSKSIPNFFQEQLFRFKKVEDFFSEINCTLWRALSLADPQNAVSVLKNVLSNASLEEKLQIKDEARNLLVSTLSHYADFKNLLVGEDSMLALAELAVAENASWSNNATGEFRNKFQFFGQSQDIFIRYFDILARMIKKDEWQYIKVTLSSLEGAINTMVNRMVPSRHSMDISWQSGMLEPGKDKTTAVHLLFVLEKINDMLPSIIDKVKNNSDLRAPFLSFLSKVTNLFRYKTLQDGGEKIFKNCSPIKEIMREDIRKILFTSAEWIRKFGNGTAEEINWIENLLGNFKDTSIKGRLREAVVDYIGYSVNEDVLLRL